MTAPELSFRTGAPADAGWLLGLFDGAVAWLVARGFVRSSRFTVKGDWTGQVFELAP